MTSATVPRGPAGFEEFYRHWLPQIKRYLTWLEADRSVIDDAAQETMASAYRYWDKVSGYENPRVWLFRVAGQRLSDERSKRRANALTDDSWFRDVPCADPIGQVDALIRVVPLLRKLPTHQVAPVVLHYYGFSDQEIGQIAGIAPATVRSSRCRALRVLKTLGGIETGSEDAR